MIIKTKNSIIAELDGKNKKLIQENENLKDKVGELEGKLDKSEKLCKKLTWQFRIMLILLAVCIIYFIMEWYG